MKMYSTVIGWLAGIGTTVSFLPQVIAVVRTRNTDQLSPFMYIIHSCGVICWIVYGILIHNIIIVVFNAVALLFTLVILFFCLRSVLCTPP